MAEPTVSLRAELRRRLAEPRGLLQLFGATFGVALVIAGAAATQRPFFERYVVEKHPATTAATRDLAARVKELSADELRGRPEAEWTELYHAYLASSGEEVEHLPRAFAAADSERIARRLIRTWHAGSDAQRQRVLAFLESAREPDLSVAVEAASRRSRPASQELSRRFQDLHDASTPLGDR